jgi:hypothetical protein
MTYRMLVRALVTKLPGFLFTGYANPILTPEAVTSWDQMAELIQDFWDTYPSAEDTFNELYSDYDFVDGVPA